MRFPPPQLLRNLQRATLFLASSSLGTYNFRIWMYLFACKNKSNFGTYNKSIAKQESCVYSSLVCCLVQPLEPNTLIQTWLPKHFIVIAGSCCLPSVFSQADIYWFEDLYTSARRQRALSARSPRLPVGTSGLPTSLFCRYFLSLYKVSFNTFFTSNNRFFFW